MADVCPANRLVRKRNSNLQKQLQVTLHLLSEEYRQSKERMYKDERDCGKFLKSLYSTVPGLVTYGQPDTRAMNSNSMLKERRYSMAVSVHSDSEEHRNPFDPPFSRAKAPSSKAANSRPKSSTLDDRGAKASTTQGEASGAQTGSGDSGVKPYTTERNSLTKKLRENSNFLPRPSTAGSQRKGGQTPAHDEQPSSGRFSQQKALNPSYGREAYSKEDRFLHERVLRRFDNIFDPETEARKVNLNTLMAPALMVEPDKEDGSDPAMDNATTPSAKIPHPHVNVIQVNGEEFHLSKKPPAQRRVVWSANPHRKPRTVSAPHSARTERKTSEMPASDSARQTSAGPKSSSHTATHAPRTKTPTAPASRPSSGKPDSRIQMLALQKNLPVKYRRQDEQSDSSLESDDDDDGDDDDGTDQDTEYLTKPSQKTPEKPKAQLNQPERSKHNKPCERERKEKEQTHTTKSHHHRSTAVIPNQHPEPKHVRYNPSSHLQVPDDHHHHHHHHHQQPHHHHHHHHHHPPDGHSSDQRGAPPGRKPSITRPSSRLSNASDITPPVELWSKLMKSGLPGRTAKRPQTAPSKSELSHRSMPAPRQTVVGILAQIENQKANTRNLINTSKELQRVVKKLVPWEQTSAYDMDDW